LRSASTDGRRQTVNTWIRAQSPADGVVDPTRIDPAYDGSDHLHFNLVGYRVMADAVPLDQLIDAVCS
jgi:lysophospholipase L1-like esterase